MFNASEKSKIEKKICEFRKELNLPYKTVTPALLDKIVKYRNATLVEEVKFVSQHNPIQIKDNDSGLIWSQSWNQTRLGFWYPKGRFGKRATILFKHNLSSDEYRVCTDCQTPKLKNEFFKCKGRYLGYTDRCKPCFKKRKELYYNNNKDKKNVRKEYLKKYKVKYNKETNYDSVYYKNNKEKAYRTSRRSALKRHYNLTMEQFDEMVEAQKNKCAICSRDFSLNDVSCNGKVKRPYVDHDHITGKVRGLLCQQCNTALGSFNDNVDYLKNAIRYIVLHKQGE